MIDDVIPAAAMSPMELELLPAPVAPQASNGWSAGCQSIVKALCIGCVALLLLPVLVVVGLVAILVPCFLRVPVCGERMSCGPLSPRR